MKTKRIISFALGILMLILVSFSVVSCQTSYEDETFYLRINTDSQRNKTYSLHEILDKEATEIVIPSEINGIVIDNIINTAFDGCTKLEKITFSETTEYIYHARNKALSACPALEEIVFNCNYLKGDEFQINYGSEDGVTITLSEGFRSTDDLFAGSTNLKKVVVLNKDWGNSDSFVGCTNLESIKFSGTKEEWCRRYQVNGIENTYSHLIIGKENDAYKNLSITVECSDGIVTFISGEAK